MTGGIEAAAGSDSQGMPVLPLLPLADPNHNAHQSQREPRTCRDPLPETGEENVFAHREGAQ